MLYHRYWTNVYNRRNETIEGTWRRFYTHPVPGNQLDKTHRCFRKFEKWYARPEKSHKLYWKLHA